jgi:hypothetical protein
MFFVTRRRWTLLFGNRRGSRADVCLRLRRVPCGKLCLEFQLQQTVLRLSYHREDAATSEDLHE